MANRWYPKGLAAILNGDVDFDTDTLAVILTDDTFAFNSAHDFLNDIPSGQLVGSRTNIAGTRVITPGTSTTVVTTSVPTTTIASVSGDDVAGVLLIVEGGSDAARRLLHHWEKQGDTTGILVETDGGDIEVTFRAGEIMRLSGGA